MAVDQERGSGHQAGIHAHGFPGIDLDEDEALPLVAVAFGLGFQLRRKVFLNFRISFTCMLVISGSVAAI